MNDVCAGQVRVLKGFCLVPGGLGERVGSQTAPSVPSAASVSQPGGGDRSRCACPCSPLLPGGSGPDGQGVQDCLVRLIHRDVQPDQVLAGRVVKVKNEQQPLSRSTRSRTRSSTS